MTAAPTPFGPFSLLEPLAAGGMGEVWLAHPTGVPGTTGLCVVKRIKSTLSGDDDVLKRFLDEGRLALLLSHPHICRTVDVGRADDSDYLAAEVVQGIDVRRLQQRAAEAGVVVDADVALQVAADALDGLAYAHDARHPLTNAPLAVVHRDVSPQNLMVADDGHTRVIDFGLALSSVRQAQTELGVVLGKLAYMSPEQARGDRVSPACDVFAVGVVLYELLTAERFYGSLTQNEIWTRAGRGDHVPARLTALPDELRAIVEALLHPDAAVRPSAALARDALLTVLWRHGEEKRARDRLRALVARLAAPELARFTRAREAAVTAAATLVDFRPTTTMSLAVQEARAVEAMLAARARSQPTMPTSAPTVELPRVAAAPTQILRASRAPAAPPSRRPEPRKPAPHRPSRRLPALVATGVLGLLVVALVGLLAFGQAPGSPAAAKTAPGSVLMPAPTTTAPTTATTTTATTTTATTTAPTATAPTTATTATATTTTAPTTAPASTTTIVDPTSVPGLLARMRALRDCTRACATVYQAPVPLDRAMAWPSATRITIASRLAGCEQECR
jgi:serine/threonine-protein kinase